MSRHGGQGGCFSPPASGVQPPLATIPPAIPAAIFFASIKRRPCEVVVFKWKRVEKNVLRPQPSPAIVLPFRSSSLPSFIEGWRKREKEKKKKKRKKKKENCFVPLTRPMFLISSVVARDKFIHGYYGLLSRQIAFLRDYNAAELGR